MGFMKNKLVYSTDKNITKKEKQGKDIKSATIMDVQQPVRIRFEKKGRVGKSVSVVSGLNLNNGELESMLKEFKMKLGTGGTLKDGNIEIQGNHCDVLLSMLLERGYKAKKGGG